MKEMAQRILTFLLRLTFFISGPINLSQALNLPLFVFAQNLVSLISF